MYIFTILHCVIALSTYNHSHIVVFKVDILRNNAKYDIFYSRQLLKYINK